MKLSFPLCIYFIICLVGGENFVDLNADLINKLSFDLNNDFASVQSAHDYLGVDFTVEV